MYFSAEIEDHGTQQALIDSILRFNPVNNAEHADNNKNLGVFIH